MMIQAASELQLRLAQSMERPMIVLDGVS